MKRKMRKEEDYSDREKIGRDKEDATNENCIKNRLQNEHDRTLE